MKFILSGWDARLGSSPYRSIARDVQGGSLQVSGSSFKFATMPTSATQRALRAYKSATWRLLRKYGLAPLLDPTEAEVSRAHKALLKKTHPDKGGVVEDFRIVQSSKVAFDQALRQLDKPATGDPRPSPPNMPCFGPPMKRPAAASHAEASSKRSSMATSQSPVMQCTELAVLSMDLCEHCQAESEQAGGYRIQSKGVLLTYNGPDLAEEDAWPEFKQWVLDHLKLWCVLYFCATLESCRRRKRHMHLMLQFHKAVDCLSTKFAFRDIRPNARPNWDYCGQGRNKKNPQQSLDRSFFYVWANKIGTCFDAGGALCVSGNYGPSWSDSHFLYEVNGDWPEKLWKRYQLTHKQYREYLIRCRDRVPGRLRNLEEAMQGEGELLDEEELKENAARIHSNSSVHKPFKAFEIAQAWLRTFLQDSHRYALFLVRGVSRTGKTELAKSWFSNPCCMKIGDLLSVFPAKMRRFDRRFHDGIVLDDIRDLQFIVNFQHVFQGKPDEEIWFAETPGGTRSYSKLLFATPFVATFNDSALNLDLLDKDDFLGNSENRIVLRLTEPPFETDELHEEAGVSNHPLPLSAVEAPSRREQLLADMQTWSAARAHTFLHHHDLFSAARLFKDNDANGADLSRMSAMDLTNSLRCSPFLAEKIVRVREAYLAH